MVVARDERQVQADDRRHHRREDEHVHDVEPALDCAGAGVLAVPQERGDRAADQRDRHRDAIGDREAHAGEQVVRQRVAGKPF